MKVIELVRHTKYYHKIIRVDGYKGVLILGLDKIGTVMLYYLERCEDYVKPQPTNINLTEHNQVCFFIATEKLGDMI